MMHKARRWVSSWNGAKTKDMEEASRRWD